MHVLVLTSHPSAGAGEVRRVEREGWEKLTKGIALQGCNAVCSESDPLAFSTAVSIY